MALSRSGAVLDSARVLGRWRVTFRLRRWIRPLATFSKRRFRLHGHGASLSKICAPRDARRTNVPTSHRQPWATTVASRLAQGTAFLDSLERGRHVRDRMAIERTALHRLEGEDADASANQPNSCSPHELYLSRHLSSGSAGWEPVHLHRGERSRREWVLGVSPLIAGPGSPLLLLARFTRCGESAAIPDAARERGGGGTAAIRGEVEPPSLAGGGGGCSSEGILRIPRIGGDLAAPETSTQGVEPDEHRTPAPRR